MILDYNLENFSRTTWQRSMLREEMNQGLLFIPNQRLFSIPKYPSNYNYQQVMKTTLNGNDIEQEVKGKQSSYLPSLTRGNIGNVKVLLLHESVRLNPYCCDTVCA